MTGKPPTMPELQAARDRLACHSLDRLVRWWKRREHRRQMMLKWRQCHNAAMLICRIGFNNIPDAQKHIDAAKDELYSAALCFRAEASSPSNAADQAQPPREPKS